jgi:tetratricopeptide (TPR) repeat protein
VDSAPREMLGRYVLTLIRAGRFRDAASFVGQIKRGNRADETTPVLESLFRLTDHDFTRARDLVQDGVDNSSLPAMVARIYADLPLAKDKEAMEIADKAIKAAPMNSDVLLAAAFAQRDPIDSKKLLIRAMSIDPAIPEAYGLQAYLIMVTREKDRYKAADQILDYALKLDPGNLYCLMAKAVCHEAQKRPQEAEPLLAQMLEADKTAPDVHVAQALNLSLLDKTLKITAELDIARKLDPDRWSDVFVAKPTELPAKVFHYRYQPLISPATLYPGK